MNVYTTDKIRNVVLLGHGGCGKTSLAEAMLYVAGATDRHGKVSDGNTVDRKSTRLNSSHPSRSRMPSSA